MNAVNEVTDTTALLMRHGFFEQVRRQEFFEAVLGGLLERRVSIVVSDGGPDGDSRVVVVATRTDGRTARARGATVAEAISKVKWSDLLT